MLLVPIGPSVDYLANFCTLSRDSFLFIFVLMFYDFRQFSFLFFKFNRGWIRINLGTLLIKVSRFVFIVMVHSLFSTYNLDSCEDEVIASGMKQQKSITIP